jgi:hypothetical protein
MSSRRPALPRRWDRGCPGRVMRLARRPSGAVITCTAKRAPCGGLCDSLERVAVQEWTRPGGLSMVQTWRDETFLSASLEPFWRPPGLPGFPLTGGVCHTFPETARRRERAPCIRCNPPRTGGRRVAHGGEGCGPGARGRGRRRTPWRRPRADTARPPGPMTRWWRRCPPKRAPVKPGSWCLPPTAGSTYGASAPGRGAVPRSRGHRHLRPVTGCARSPRRNRCGSAPGPGGSPAARDCLSGPAHGCRATAGTRPALDAS